MKSANQYTAEELQQLRDMARAREAEAAKVKTERPVVPGSLVKYVDSAGHEHTALVLELLSTPAIRVDAKGEQPVVFGDVKTLRLKVFRQTRYEVVEAGPGRWRR